jgi:hypothetical protein
MSEEKRMTFEAESGDRFGLRPNKMRVVSQAGGGSERGLRPNQGTGAPPPPPPPPSKGK